MLEVYPTDRVSLERDCNMDFFIASGPGGQHRNKVETGVRLVHRPTGTMVTATERRSQTANRDMAFERMAAKLDAMQEVPTLRKLTHSSSASRRKRLETKHSTSQVKRLRSTPHPE